MDNTASVYTYNTISMTKTVTTSIRQPRDASLLSNNSYLWRGVGCATGSVPSSAPRRSQDGLLSLYLTCVLGCAHYPLAFATSSIVASATRPVFTHARRPRRTC